MNEEMIKMLKSLMQHASSEEREAYDRFLESCLGIMQTHSSKFHGDNVTNVINGNAANLKEDNDG
jgi:hypothetical protein